MESFIVFDTETSGLPSKFANVSSGNYNHWDSCRMIQIAWEIYTDSKDESPISSSCHIVQPNGFEISKTSTAIHGISNDVAATEGIPVVEVIKLFEEAVKKYNVKTIVAHNIKFDINVLYSEVYRESEKLSHLIPTFNNLKRHCTMLVGTPRGGRWSKLAALYERVVGELPSDTMLHTADADTMLCACIYKKQMNALNKIVKT